MIWKPARPREAKEEFAELFNWFNTQLHRWDGWIERLIIYSTKYLYNRYDDMRKGEPARKIQGKKRLFRDNSAPVSLEKVKIPLS